MLSWGSEESAAVAAARIAFKGHPSDKLERMISRVSKLEQTANNWRTGFLFAVPLIALVIFLLAVKFDVFDLVTPGKKDRLENWSKFVGAFLVIWSPLLAVVSPKVEFKPGDYVPLANEKPHPADLIPINRALALPSARFDKAVKLFDAVVKALAVYLLL